MTGRSPQLPQRIESLIERDRELRLRLLSHPAPETDTPLFEAAERLLADTVEVLAEIEGRASAAGEPEPTVPALADLAALARQEVSVNLQTLRSARQRGEGERVAQQADSALERAERALGAVEGVLRQLLGLPDTDRSRQRLEESLEIRRTYAALRRSILAAQTPTASALLSELWLVGAQIDAIRRRESRALLRLDDRYELHRLLERIRTALSDPDPAREADRRALWHDIAGFSQLLMSIQEREELRAYDLELVVRARRRLAAGADRGPVYRTLAPLLGRDPDLDRVLTEPGVAPPVDGELLLRLEDRLRQLSGWH